MAVEERRVTREQLYEDVWKEPMRTLAQRYGLSDVGLAKTCKRLRVPVPGRGYWAKKAAGKRVRQSPLPPFPPTSVEAHKMVTLKPQISAKVRPCQPEIIRKQIEFEKNPSNTIVVKGTLHAAHKLVARTRDLLVAQTNERSPLYRNYAEPRLDIQVSDALLSRALRVMDALVRACEKRGWSVSATRWDAQSDRKTYATVLGQRVPFGIREKQKKVENKHADSLWEPKHLNVPSGRLALVIRNRWGNGVEISLEDTLEAPIELRLNDFMVAIVERAYEDLIWDASAEESARTRLIEDARRAERLRKQERENAQIAKLESDAEDWNRTRLIASYLAALRTKIATESGQNLGPFEEWLQWADGYVARLDPLRKPLMDLVEVGNIKAKEF